MAGVQRELGTSSCRMRTQPRPVQAIMRPVREEGHRACVWVGAAGQVVGVGEAVEGGC